MAITINIRTLIYRCDDIDKYYELLDVIYKVYLNVG